MQEIEPYCARKRLRLNFRSPTDSLGLGHKNHATQRVVDFALNIFRQRFLKAPKTIDRICRNKFPEAPSSIRLSFSLDVEILPTEAPYFPHYCYSYVSLKSKLLGNCTNLAVIDTTSFNAAIVPTI